uniref:Uncharacterized protein n=1 Tax=Callorhinchus milii TaxID=7868 RepID=A0A4W3I770_CALMI
MPDQGSNPGPLLDSHYTLQDDCVSGASEWECQEQRLCAMEQRLQLQEDELTLVKSALVDALRRIRVRPLASHPTASLAQGLDPSPRTPQPL